MIPAHSTTKGVGRPPKPPLRPPPTNPPLPSHRLRDQLTPHPPSKVGETEGDEALRKLGIVLHLDAWAAQGQADSPRLLPAVFGGPTSFCATQDPVPPKTLPTPANTDFPWDHAGQGQAGPHSAWT